MGCGVGDPPNAKTLKKKKKNFKKTVVKLITFLKVGTNENGSACGRWLSIGI
jgi:hypothetical protein